MSDHRALPFEWAELRDARPGATLDDDLEAGGFPEPLSLWRDRGEVDFVVRRHDGGVVPVQVTWDAPGDRHRRALENFYERFPQAAEAVFVTADRFEDALAELS